jgi:hypothetical protein
MIHYAKIIPALMLFAQFLVPFIRWATNVLTDDVVTVDEVKHGVDTFWPKRDAEGNPVAISVPWAKKAA